MIKVGDKVKILKKDIFYLQYRHNRTGIVTGIDGDQITVRPNWVYWTIQLSPNEFEVIG